ncbi:hypothetical protein CEUSTIGMA_g10661.t1 [Chlamydomonas eustigma]|uniref:Uncharacterized protein n=1 Tax=Chlamydomonas eustigma TaxID=1157962 RepID=A0A250XJH4_9CHLO|nr:hypothetical protein CEUSTIGMA_g10661.t1 [Chlamydomonas eustigma]|eukprot:GAX83235.1 hypothetical protein CEUSTIGMA_g10661.t1 [Chlamydomonas eustigma]
MVLKKETRGLKAESDGRIVLEAVAHENPSQVVAEAQSNRMQNSATTDWKISKRPGMQFHKNNGASEAMKFADMFQAVFPDMRGITGASRVAAYSGSLTMTLAFGGIVYWLSTTNERGRKCENSAGSEMSGVRSPSPAGG